MRDRILYLVSLFILSLALASKAKALPWDEDLFKQQSFKPNELTRAPVTGTVPVGFQPFKMDVTEAEAKLKNPVEFSRDSVWSGQRLWSANCLTCHGSKGDGQGPVGPQMSVPNLLTDFYKSKADGRVFAVIHNGGANMPRYGYKLSAEEKWDLVNFLRFLQGKDVVGMDRPK